MRRYLLLVGIALLLAACSGCATKSQFEATYGTWVGASLKEFEDAYGPLQRVAVEGENVIYKYKMMRMKDCTIYWTVNKEGMIIKWRHEGADCALSPLN